MKILSALSITKPFPFMVLAIVFSLVWLFWGSVFLNILGVDKGSLFYFISLVTLIFLSSLYFVNINSIPERFVYSLFVALIVPYFTFVTALAAGCILPPHSCL